ncbi:MAG: 2-amino-4-hydroxy-6-hydroxymethyldihydropteridine diphosphokinase [Syntrophales bacterium]|jgi:2-amino-4-hydroxy-6-hydroxymethyldihydropteridine diphosphokinase|nr:2-amino-4-hydroxy-6-hydroxymethyldihydropteridine diphosphokinase [Syntrophales bacterium]MDD4340530.1 2-amino-4-hydroxy-6-hydroxymethyldihydropteridine diphosphokinase [Syntrophales bacterium]HOG08735.1 2-amino-4-hydroxy-6-hydroxymethyldihydropteridine diphosphokinase [Syntrophales bacterium]HOS78510.1 2-amino-4-hydroxy-6-hydroxymethyldihydropteridine diphosphokinase [Syntrophales bacterium]HPB71234.1 2-amino-4-hydroxy-6-hydroxymethyldihydropteridine diphosphokinase [Syntrophales bacterium]
MRSGIISFIGVGANLGRPEEQCRDALRRVGERDGIALLRVASLYRTEPLGDPDQPCFVNTVAELRTTLSPLGLLSKLAAIEGEMGRRRSGRSAEPRLIDLDLLLYGQEVVAEADLVVPHPRMHERRFVLVPMNEIAAYVLHPAFGVSMQGLLSRCRDSGRVEKIGEGETHERTE